MQKASRQCKHTSDSHPQLDTWRLTSPVCSCPRVPLISTPLAQLLKSKEWGHLGLYYSISPSISNPSPRTVTCSFKIYHADTISHLLHQGQPTQPTNIPCLEYCQSLHLSPSPCSVYSPYNNQSDPLKILPQRPRMVSCLIKNIGQSLYYGLQSPS